MPAIALLKNLFLLAAGIWLIFSATACSPPAQSQPAPSAVPSSTGPISPQTVINYTYNVIKAYPHDPRAFTEGLVFDQGVLYESTGLVGDSSLRKVDLESGKVLQMHSLTGDYFGEGLTTYQASIIQLTWQSHTGFVYDKNTFQLLREFTYPTEGWGLTHDNSQLIVSDGTSTIYFWDPATFTVRRQIQVNQNGAPVDQINELELIQGKIYANIWLTNKIAIIEPQDGRISGWIDLTGLLQTQNYTGTVDVLNGIAYDSGSNRLFVTGKYWPYLFQIELVKLPPPTP